MKNFKSSTNKIVYAEMFGFHFDTDADITIECNVKVCATSSSDSTCTIQTVSIWYEGYCFWDVGVEYACAFILPS